MNKKISLIIIALATTILSGCAGKSEQASILPADTDAVIPDNGSLIDIISIGMSEDDAKTILSNNNVDYKKDGDSLISKAVTSFTSYAFPCSLAST